MRCSSAGVHCVRPALFFSFGRFGRERIWRPWPGQLGVGARISAAGVRPLRPPAPAPWAFRPPASGTGRCASASSATRGMLVQPVQHPGGLLPRLAVLICSRSGAWRWPGRLARVQAAGQGWTSPVACDVDAPADPDLRMDCCMVKALQRPEAPGGRAGGSACRPTSSSGGRHRRVALGVEHVEGVAQVR